MEQNSVNASTSDSASGDVDYKALYESTENRRKDAQSTLTPVQQENARLKAELATLKTIPQALPVDVQEKLDELKYSDPDTWRVELNKAEADQMQNTEASIKTKQGEIISEMSQEDIVRRTKSFFATHPEVDPKVIIDSMPKKLQEQLDNGTLSLEEALQKGIDLVNGATVMSVLAPSTPDIGKVAGSEKPSDKAKVEQSSQDWASAIV